MAEIYANNVRGKLAEPILAADSSITLQPGHNFLDPGSNWYRATLFRWEFTSEGIREFDHEVVKVTALAGDVLTVERELEGVALAFDPDTPIELRMTAGTAAAIESRAGQALMDHTEAEDPHTQYEQKTALKAAAYRGVVGGSGDLMALGAFGTGETLDAQDIADFDLLPQGRSLTAQTDLTNAPLTSGRFLVITDIRNALYSQIAIQRDTGKFYFRGGSTLSQAKGHGWNLVFSSRSVLGPVSQTGGIPTGALFEVGSNANGNYIKFASGDMWCTRQVQTSELDHVTWDFPAQFIDSDVRIQLTPGGTQLCSAIWDAPPSNSSVRISARAPDGTTAGVRLDRSVSAEARGRW